MLINLYTLVVAALSVQSDAGMRIKFIEGYVKASNLVLAGPCVKFVFVTSKMFFGSDVHSL